MQIIHIIEPFASGVTTAVINIARQLTEVNHLVIHGSRMWVDNIENVRSKFPENTEFISWKNVGREISIEKDMKAFWELRKILKPYRKKDIVIHLHSSKAGFIGRAACWSLGIKRVIYTPHCPAFIRTDISARKKSIYRAIEKMAGIFGGQIVGCGESEAELFKELGFKTKWVANGVEPQAPVKKQDPDKVTFVGIVNDQKQPAYFNKIAEALSKDNVNFIWVGDGELKEKLTASNIKLTGWVEKGDIESYLSETLIYLSTAGWEGLPFGVLEAMNASCALLLSDVPGNRDCVKKGVNGYLFHNEEEAVTLLKKMLTDTEGTIKMGIESNRLIEDEFSLKQMGEKYLEIYKSFF